jgi:hypothetical protein
VLNRLTPFRIFAAVPLVFAAAGLCQTSEIPRQDAGTVNQGYDAAHLKDRAYDGNLPKPIYPSTERVQREFTVHYVYGYAYSSYTPGVTLPILGRAQVKLDTPEDALIALLSATRTGDYEGWLACWDEPARQHFLAAAKDQKQDAAFWQKVWKQFFGTVKEVILVDRVETVGYVILDARMTGAMALPVPTAFKHVDGKWKATNELGSDPMLMNFRSDLAGIVQRVSPQPVKSLVDGYGKEAEAQQEFLRNHTVVNAVTRPAK